jgi:hypothetical protein
VKDLAQIADLLRRKLVLLGSENLALLAITLITAGNRRADEVFSISCPSTQIFAMIISRAINN